MEKIIVIIFIIILFILLICDNNENFNNNCSNNINNDINNNINNDINNKITFIIPTIGRKTLSESVKSLQKQTNPDWNAIIIFDGIKSNIKLDDPRIKIIEIDKKGKDKNSAGLVRNNGIKLVKTKWIGFLDDDDYIADDYVEKFYEELKLNPDLDVLIYRMKDKENIFPELETDNFYLNHVGISFIINNKIFNNNLEFIPSSSEDFDYLDRIRTNKYKIIISPSIKYFVRSNGDFGDINKFKNIKGKRILINY
jgi:glycosyltransferase involved in cell wall biosynthesis